MKIMVILQSINNQDSSGILWELDFFLFKILETAICILDVHDPSRAIPYNNQPWEVHADMLAAQEGERHIHYEIKDHNVDWDNPKSEDTQGTTFGDHGSHLKEQYLKDKARDKSIYTLDNMDNGKMVKRQRNLLQKLLRKKDQVHMRFRCHHRFNSTKGCRS